MKSAVIQFGVSIVAGVAAMLIAEYLKNNVRPIRRAVGSL